MLQSHLGVRIALYEALGRPTCVGIEPGWPGLFRETKPGRTHLVKVIVHACQQADWWLVDEAIFMIELRLHNLLCDLYGRPTRRTYRL